MSRVAVVADNTGYLPSAIVEANDIALVSLYVNFGADRTERESAMPSFDAFYEELRSAEILPTTSQPSIGDFTAVYEPLLAEGRDVVSVHLSGGVSGTVDAARAAAETLERDGKGGERVRVVDTETTAGGLGLLVMAAARRAAAGDDLDAVAARINEARSQLKMWFAVDTLEYFRRSGRIGGASAWIGSTLKIKPILTIEREITPVERVRTSARAFERMVAYARQRHASGADAWTVQHIQSPQEAERLADECREIFGCEPQFVSEVGPVLGVHAGPGMLGVGSIPRSLAA